MPIPILVSPINYSVDVPLTTVLDWNSIDNSLASVDYYMIQIDTVTDFSSSFLISGTNTFLGFSDNDADTEYELANLDSSKTYFWRVRTKTGSVYSDWSSTWRFNTVDPPVLSMGETQALYNTLNVFPNPSSGLVTIGFELEKSAKHVTIQVFNVLGRRISSETSSFEGSLFAGKHSIPLEISNKSGLVFVYLIVDGESISSAKLLLSNR
jgi:hypothetical protein